MEYDFSSHFVPSVIFRLYIITWEQTEHILAEELIEFSYVEPFLLHQLLHCPGKGRVNGSGHNENSQAKKQKDLVSEWPSRHLIRFNVGIDSLSAALECLPGVSEILQQNLTNITIFPLQRSPTELEEEGGYML